MAPLVGGDLVVDQGFPAQARIRTAKNLERRPFQTDGLELGSHGPVPEVVSQDRGPEILRREQEGVRRLLAKPAEPFLQVCLSTRREGDDTNGSLALPPFRAVKVAPVDTLVNQNRMIPDGPDANR